VADIADKCPEIAGRALLGGCPDRDNDGITDADDVCPDIPGAAVLKGCPDTDNDGLTDNMDDCPKQAGPVAMKGCPDTDKDGIADNADRCPTKSGPVSNFGCPEVRIEVLKRLSHIASALEFETGKAVIKVSSYGMLDETVVLLDEYADYYADVEGHTDAVGSAESNIILSRDRAGSVVQYFIAKGISADRFEIRGMGESMPIASNSTKEGKAQNRRVIMSLRLRSK
jgi:outer membrane protein OmpA-like peptidoglycan-associated protein